MITNERQYKVTSAQLERFKTAIDDRIHRLVDLWDPFRKRLIYTPEMGGSLSLKAVLDKPKDPETWLLARKFAKHDLAASEGSAKAWAHGTMAELEMLATYHTPDQVARNVKKMVREHCKAIVDLMGEDSFEVYSTRRQFQRYLDYWVRKEWQSIAQAAVDTLSPLSGKGQSELPPYA